MSRVSHLLTAIVLAASASWSGAATVSSAFGVDNAFGVDPAPLSGDEVALTFNLFSCADIGGQADCVGYETFSYTHSYALGGPATAASLQLFTAGWGLYAAAEVWVNNVFVGALADGEADSGVEYAWLDTFDLTPLLGSINLTGNDTVELRIATGDPLILDGGALDFSLLQVQYSPNNAVPTPTTLALVGAGLLGLALRRSRPV